jgi:hypothetical protein
MRDADGNSTGRTPVGMRPVLGGCLSGAAAVVFAEPPDAALRAAIPVGLARRSIRLAGTAPLPIRTTLGVLRAAPGPIAFAGAGVLDSSSPVFDALGAFLANGETALCTDTALLLGRGDGGDTDGGQGAAGNPLECLAPALAAGEASDQFIKLLRIHRGVPFPIRHRGQYRGSRRRQRRPYIYPYTASAKSDASVLPRTAGILRPVSPRVYHRRGPRSLTEALDWVRETGR